MEKDERSLEEISSDNLTKRQELQVIQGFKKVETKDPLKTFLVDIANPTGVEVQFSEDFTRLWVNIDGVCRLRVQGIPIDGLSVEFPGKI